MEGVTPNAEPFSHPSAFAPPDGSETTIPGQDSKRRAEEILDMRIRAELEATEVLRQERHLPLALAAYKRAGYLIASRTPEHVARLERERGLR
jgi:hypothetical protein